MEYLEKKNQIKQKYKVKVRYKPKEGEEVYHFNYADAVRDGR